MGHTDVQQAVRLDAWRAVFEKTNRIISERPVKVRIVSSDDLPNGYDHIPGWSDGETVYFNGPLVVEMLRTKDPVSAVLRLKGLNYHELSHVLYTPRLSDELPKKVIRKRDETKDGSWWYCMNALEDQRIETWFTASYGPSRRYFEAAILQWLVDEGNADVAILVYGRKYLPAQIRVQAGDVFVKKYGPDLYREFQTVIDAYLTIRLPGETVKAFGLISKFHELLQKMSGHKNGHIPNLPIQDNGCADPSTSGGRHDPSVVRTGRVLVKAANDAADRAQKDIEKAAQADAEVEKAKDAAQQGGDQTSDGASQPDGADGDAQGQSAEGDASDTNQPVDGASATGSGKPEAVVDAAKDLADAVRDMIDQAHDGLDDIQDDDRVMQDVEQILDAVKAIEADGRMDASGKNVARQTSRAATEVENLTTRKVTQILMKIRQDLEPQVMRRQVQGRVDIRRVLSRRPHEIDIFNRWDEGAEEATGIEAVILMDISQSMTTRQDDASAAIWVLKRAFDRLEIRTTVLVYNTDHYILYQPSDKAAPSVTVIRAQGGTNPLSALQQVQRILVKSNAPNKVLINVTDGQWQVGERHIAPIMRHLHGLGVTTLLLGLDGAVSAYGSHFSQIAHDLDHVRHLPKVALKLVAGIMRSARNRV